MRRRRRLAHRCASDNFGNDTTLPISADPWPQSALRRRCSHPRIDLSSLGTLFCRDSLLWLQIELAQPWQHFFCKQRDVGDRVFMVEETALAEHQQVAKPADTVAERLDLVVHVIRCAGEAGTALDQLLYRGGGLFDRIAVPIPDEAAALAAR